MSDEYTDAEKRLYFNLQDDLSKLVVPDWESVFKIVICRAANERDEGTCVAVLEPQGEGAHRIPRITMLSHHKSTTQSMFVALEIIGRWQGVTGKTHPEPQLLDRHELSQMLGDYKRGLSH